MPQNRYYLDAPFHKANAYALTEGEWHHLVNVSKARPNTKVELVNGRGQLAQGKVQTLHKRSADIFIEDVFTEQKTKPAVILALAMPKKNHLEWIIEKGTELDATHFWLFPGMRSEITELSPAFLQRVIQLTIAAMKQSGRLDLPSVEFKPPLLQWPQLEGTLLFGDVSPQAPYLWTLKKTTATELPIILFTGPESGLHSQEETFLKHTLKATGIRLHPNILRAETAPLVGLSLIQTILD